MAGNPFTAAARGRARAGVGASLALLAGALLPACRTPASERAPDARYEAIRPEWRGTEPRPSREWLRFSVGYLDREQPRGDPVGDGLAWGIDGGLDLSRTFFTPSVEMGVAYTSAHVTVPNVDDVELWRATVGMRGTWYADGWRPYVRAGAFLRWSTKDLEEPYDPYATGGYVGAGIDWPYLGKMWLGPSVTYFQALGEDAPGGDGQELIFALSATFRL
ncbi:MAG: hypothetical protein NTY35_10595 [Planctomycetota bacterium]|nr:hypothetical protein [Planctomycetota bacterium]